MTYSSGLPSCMPSCMGTTAGTLVRESGRTGSSGDASTVMFCITTGVGSPRTHPSTLTVATNPDPEEYSATAAPVNSTAPAPPSGPNTEAAYLVWLSTVHTGSPVPSALRTSSDVMACSTSTSTGSLDANVMEPS